MSIAGPGGTSIYPEFAHAALGTECGFCVSIYLRSYVIWKWARTSFTRAVISDLSNLPQNFWKIPYWTPDVACDPVWLFKKYGKIHLTKCAIFIFKCTCSVTLADSHCCAATPPPISRSFSSYKTGTLSPLNTKQQTPFPCPSPWQPPAYFLCSLIWWLVSYK